MLFAFPDYAPCAVGSFGFSDSCYTFVSELHDPDVQRSTCFSDHRAHTVAVTSYMEINFLHNIITEMPYYTLGTFGNGRDILLCMTPRGLGESWTAKYPGLGPWESYTIHVQI